MGAIYKCVCVCVCLSTSALSAFINGCVSEHTYGPPKIQPKKTHTLSASSSFHSRRRALARAFVQINTNTHTLGPAYNSVDGNICLQFGMVLRLMLLAATAQILLCAIWHTLYTKLSPQYACDNYMYKVAHVVWLEFFAMIGTFLAYNLY